MCTSRMRRARSYWPRRSRTTRSGGGRDRSRVGPELDKFWALAAELAERTQQELGLGYEVLYQTPQGGWRWVLSPAARTYG